MMTNPSVFWQSGAACFKFVEYVTKIANTAQTTET